MYELLCYNGKKYTYTIHIALSVIKSSLVLCHKVIKLLPHRKIDWTVGEKGGYCHYMNDSREPEKKKYNNCMEYHISCAGLFWLFAHYK